MICRIGNPAGSTIRAKAFTLVEILIVIVILGILAAIIIPNMAGVTEEARRAAFVREVKVFADAAMVFRVRTGGFLEPAGPGIVPDGFETYIDAKGWSRPTPIGGQWDCLLDDLGVVAAIGVDFGDEARDDDYMTQLDASFDDGDLADGMFRKLADGQFCYVIEDDDY